MKARFIGDPNDNFSGANEITVWGVDFVKGEWTTVKDPRFTRHSHFETKGGNPALDHDFDGEAGGSVPADLSKLTVPQLKEVAERRNIDLGDATKKADIIAMLELVAEAQAGADSESGGGEGE